MTIFEADLTVPGSFMAAIDGCVAVLHTASPFFVGGREYKMQKLLEPALAGTKNVFDTCIKRLDFIIQRDLAVEKPKASSKIANIEKQK